MALHLNKAIPYGAKLSASPNNKALSKTLIAGSVGQADIVSICEPHPGELYNAFFFDSFRCSTEAVINYEGNRFNKEQRI